MGEEGRPDAVRERFTAHVAGILGRSAIPAAERDDVAEELLGHLESRYAEAAAAGLGPDEATAEVLASFGTADAVGHEFMTAYRGRLWASTIGQLLPVAGADGDPPGVIVWMARFDRAVAVFSAVAAIVLLVTEPPVRAVLNAALGLYGAAVLWVAAIALRRGQGWALAVSAFILVVNVAILVTSLRPPNGGWNLSINGLIGLLLLAALIVGWDRVSAWVAGSRPIPDRLGWPIGVLLVAWALVAGFTGRLPDPTQIGPSDIRATAVIACSVPAGSTEGGEPLVPAPTIDLRIIYDRVDVFPRGVLRDAGSWGDVIEVSVEPFSVFPGDIRATSAAPGANADPLDVSALTDLPPSASEIDDQQDIVGEILGTEQRAGRILHIVIPTTTQVGDDRPPEEVGTPLEGMVATIRVHHLDRFTLQGFGECGKAVALEPRH